MSWESFLASTALFAGVPRPVLQELAAQAVRRAYRKGSVVFVQGERGQRCFAILSGTVKISSYTPDGREAVLAILGPGDVFGELSVFDDAPRSANATALEDAELLSIDRRAITKAIASHPSLGLQLVRVMAARLRQTNEALAEIAFFDVPGRLARRLADLASSHGKPADGGTLIDLPLSQEGLAAMVGATRESVNKALAAFRRRGLVVRRGRRYLVTDAEALRARAR